jgi:hypothetical protein
LHEIVNGQDKIIGDINWCLSYFFLLICL